MNGVRRTLQNRSLLRADSINTAKTLDEILKNNDVQVFDLQSDTGVTHNLALEPEKNRGTILRMNKVLNTHRKGDRR